MLRASDLTAFTLLSAEGLEESDNEQDLQGIPEMEGEGDENEEVEGEVDEEDAVGLEGERRQHENLEYWGPENLGEEEEGVGLTAEASSHDEGVESTEAGGQQAASAAGDSEGHHQHVLEGLERLSGLGAPGVIGNLSRLVIDFDAHLEDFNGHCVVYCCDGCHTFSLLLNCLKIVKCVGACSFIFPLLTSLLCALSATLRVTKKQQKWEAASSMASSSWSILNGSEGTEVEVVKDLGLSQPISVRTHLPPHRLGKPGGDIMG